MKQMNTIEMITVADISGDVYIKDDMRYQKDKGFYDDMGEIWGINAFTGMGDEKGDLYYVIHMTDWKKYTKQKMTIAKIEEELGYEIEIVKDK
jgi:hypothetical protein